MRGDTPDPAFEELLHYLRQNRGFDFTGYKRPSLISRVARRMEVVGLEEYGDYQDYLEVHPDEFAHLFNTILINVTAFFRDPGAWDCLATEVIPSIVERSGDEVIRVWSAGCASGEEPYTLALLFAEALGLEAAQRRLKIYATDVDETALTRARQAVYSRDAVKPIPPPMRDKYFEETGVGYALRGDLRRTVIFGRHDLIQDAPVGRLDLLVCRNTLIYFNAETQQHIVARFHFALKDEGLLFLGRAEMLQTRSELFIPRALDHRIFMKVPQPGLPGLPLPMGEPEEPEPIGLANAYARLRNAAFESVPCAHLVVDLNSRLAIANGYARDLFGIDTRDVGRPFQDL
jgi:two-component system CheB/CheR fusion protein